jgi:tetratricopeptide (TPR) repeat protein
MKLKYLLSVVLLAGSLTCLAQGYKDGIEYYKVGKYDNAEELLKRNIDNAGSDKSLVDYYLGMINLHQGELNAAKGYFDQGVAENAANAYNFVGLGAFALKQGDLKGATDNFKLASSKSKKDPKIATAIARAYYFADSAAYKKDIDKNIAQAKKFNMRDPEVYMFQGDIAADHKDWGTAAGMYEMAQSFDPSLTEAYVKYADTYFNVNPEIAIQKLQELLKVNPNSALAQRELAEKYYKDNQGGKAAEQYGIYIKNPNHFNQDVVRYVQLLFFGDKFQESYDLAKQLLSKLQPGDKDIFYMKRMVMYNMVAMNKDKQDADWASVETAAKDFFATPVPPKGSYEVRDFTDYATILKSLKRPQEAIAQYVKAAELNPEKTEILKDISGEYNELEDYANAAKYYQMYVDKGDYKVNDLFVLSKRYSNLAVTTKDAAVKADAIAKSLKYVNEVNDKVPGDYRILGQKALVQSLVGTNNRDAVDTYSQVLEILDKDSKNLSEHSDMYIKAYSYMAQYYFDKGDKATAKEYYRKWLQADPSNGDLRKYVDSLK